MTEYTEHIKANLPASADEYESGNGEGVWLLVTKAAKAAHDADETGKKYEGVLDNDSWNDPDLIHGTVLPFELRGTSRPVVPFDWLQENYTPAGE